MLVIFPAFSIISSTLKRMPGRKNGKMWINCTHYWLRVCLVKQQYNLGENFMKMLKLFTLLVSVLVVFGSSNVFAGAANAESPCTQCSRKTVYEALLDPERDFTQGARLFRTAFEDETLRRWFDTDHDATIFLPTNDAVYALLDRLSEDDRTRLFDVNNGLLANVLRFHVVPGNWHHRWLRDQTAIGSIKTISTRDDLLTVSAETEGPGSVLLRVEGSHVTRQVLYQNGALMGVDSVLLPPDAPEWLGCAWDTSEHDNNLYFQSFSSLSASYNWFVVTSCQPHASDPVTNGSGFLVKAGRHDSSGPADSFNQGLTSKNMLVTEDWTDNTPSELNFAFSSNITATISGQTFTCGDVRFGQGSTDATNNWWVGQPDALTCAFASENATTGIVLKCDVASGDDMTLFLSQLLPGPSEDDTFNVNVVPAGMCP